MSVIFISLGDACLAFFMYLQVSQKGQFLLLSCLFSILAPSTTLLLHLYVLLQSRSVTLSFSEEENERSRFITMAGWVERLAWGKIHVIIHTGFRGWYASSIYVRAPVIQVLSNHGKFFNYFKRFGPSGNETFGCGGFQTSENLMYDCLQWGMPNNLSSWKFKVRRKTGPSFTKSEWEASLLATSVNCVGVPW